MSQLSLSTFKVNITPPVGIWNCGGLNPKIENIDDDIWLRGIIVHTPETRYLIAAIDFCYMIGKSQYRFEQALAQAAEIPTEQVCLQSNHIHAAPMLNEEIHLLLEQLRPEFNFHNETYVKKILKASEEAVQFALFKKTDIHSIGYSSHPVHNYASTRRVINEKQKSEIRWSVTEDLKVKHAPVGLIDPLLDQIQFFDRDEKAIAVLNFYASHPQIGYIPGSVNRDSIGPALDLFEKTHPDVFPIYFDGCGGDITAGKYSSKNVNRNNLEFGLKLFDAMEEAFLKSNPQKDLELHWKHQVFDCPLREQNYAKDSLIQHIQAPNTSPNDAYLHTIKLDRLQRQNKSHPFHQRLIKFGAIGMLFLPSELTIEYQLFSKENFQGSLAVAAYGDSYFNYIATDIAFDQGGYEVQKLWTEVDKGIEGIIKKELSNLFQT